MLISFEMFFVCNFMGFYLFLIFVLIFIKIWWVVVIVWNMILIEVILIIGLYYKIKVIFLNKFFLLKSL